MTVFGGNGARIDCIQQTAWKLASSPALDPGQKWKCDSNGTETVLQNLAIIEEYGGEYYGEGEYGEGEYGEYYEYEEGYIGGYEIRYSNFFI